MAGLAEILLRLKGDNSDANAKLDETSDKLDEFDTKKVAAQVLVDADDAEAKIAEVDAELHTIPDEKTVHLRLSLAGEEANLADLESRIAALQATAASGVDSKGRALSDRALETTIPRNIGNLATRAEASSQKIEKLRSDLENLGSGSSVYERALSSMLQDTESLGTDGDEAVRKLGSDFDLLGGKVGSARSGVLGLVSDLTEKIPVIGSLFSSAFGLAEKASQGLENDFGGIVSDLPSMIAGFAEAAPIILVVGAAVAALVTSLAEAVLGVIALGVAFVAALGPIAIVLGVVLDKIKDIVEGQVQLSDATANLKSAIESQKEAVTELQQAQQNESTQRLAALQAERQAYLNLLQAQDAVADDRLNVQNAQLQLMQANLTLSQFKQGLAGLGLGPSDLVGAAQNVSVSGQFGQTQAGANQLEFEDMLLQWKEDLLGVKTAAQGVHDANTQLLTDQGALTTAAQDWEQYVEKGPRAYQPYQQALNSVATANENLARAIDQVKSAELEKDQAIKHGAGEASTFMKAWDNIKSALGKILGPAETAAFTGIEKALDNIAGHRKDLEPLVGAFADLGRAIGGAFVWWSQMMTKPENVKLLSQLIKGAAGLTRDFSKWLGHGLKFIIEIAVDAMPKLLGAISHWATWLGNIDSHQKSIKSFIDKCIGQTELWWHRIESVASKAATILNDLTDVFNVLKKIWPLLAGLAAMKVSTSLLSLVGGVGKLFGLGGAATAGEGASLGAADVLGPGALALGAGGAIGTMIDKDLGLPTLFNMDSASAANAAQLKELQSPEGTAQDSLVAAMTKSLQTGIEQYGPDAGRRLTASLEQAIENGIYEATGTHYRGSVAKPVGSTTVVHNHNYSPGTIKNPDDHAATLQRRLHHQGRGVGIH